MSFASDTKVDTASTQAEIQNTLIRFGADGFMAGQQRLPNGTDCAMIAFQFKAKTIKVTMKLPSRDEPRFTKSPTGKVSYDVNQRHKLWEQACKSKWRALGLSIKAKLVAIEEGISTVEHEFLAWMVLPNGRTAGEHFLPQIEDAATSGKMPTLGLMNGGPQ